MSDTELDKVLTQRHEANQTIVNVEEATIKLVVFELAQQGFAFHSESIREVLGHATVFFVPIWCITANMTKISTPITIG